MRRFFFACLLSSSALATTLTAMDVTALTRASTLVVRGRVVRVDAMKATSASNIVTLTELAVSEVLKGPRMESAVTVIQPGGVVGRVGQRVHGAATFSLGDEVVVFLEPVGRQFGVVGMAQGRFVVDRSGPTPLVRGGEAGLSLIDPATRRLGSSAVTQMSLAQLEQLVRGAGLDEQPRQRGTETQVTP